MRNPQNDLPGAATHAPLAIGALLRAARTRALGRRRAAPPPPPRPVTSGRRSALLIGLLMSLLPLFAHAERSAAVEVAMVTDLAGRVERQPRTIELWSRVGLDEAVALFDAMRTWEQSTAELRFVDGTVVMLDEKTRLRISPMLFDPSQAPQEVQLALAEGSAEVRAGTRRLWIDTGDGEPKSIEPGGAARLTAGGGGDVHVGLPASPAPIDLERGQPVDRPGGADRAPPNEPDPERPETDAPDRPRPFDPVDGRLDPTGVVDQVVDAVPGGATVDVRLPGGEGVLVVLPELPIGPGDPMPGPDQMPPEMQGLPGVDGLPTLPGGPDGLLRDLVPDGIVTGLDDLPPAPTAGRVRVEVEIRRR